MSLNVGVIGGGLSGLVLGQQLKNKGLNFTVLEARENAGGRIQTIIDDEYTQVELGATWFGASHVRVISLLKSLGINIYEQYQEGKAVFEASSMTPVQEFALPGNQPPSYRIEAGSSNLINQLLKGISDHVLFDSPVSKVIKKENKIQVEYGEGKVIEFDLLVATLPPRLLVNTLAFDPQLPENIKQISNQTQTWMGNSIKFAVTYKKPFWREAGFGGIGFSNSSIASEIHDHTNEKENKFALKGFLSPGAIRLSPEFREKMVIEQLIRFYGEDSSDYVAYHEKLWALEEYTMGGMDNDMVPHQNQGHEIYRNSFLDDSFMISGSETSPIDSGYMEGAIFSSELAMNWIKSKI